MAKSDGQITSINISNESDDDIMNRSLDSLGSKRGKQINTICLDQGNTSRKY